MVPVKAVRNALCQLVHSNTNVCVCVLDVSVLPGTLVSTVSWIITTVKTTSVTMELSASMP